MSNGYEAVEERKKQAQVEGNKKFIMCMKKLSKILYGKIDITPDPEDPLKNTIAYYKTPWFNLELRLKLKEVRKRYGWQSGADYYDRYQFSPRIKIVYRGPQNTRSISDVMFKINSRTPKRLVDELIKQADIMYSVIESENDHADEQRAKEKLINDTRSRIKGLVCKGNSFFIGGNEVTKNTYGSIAVQEDGSIRVSRIEMTVDQFNDVTLALGWRKDNG